MALSYGITVAVKESSGLWWSSTNRWQANNAIHQEATWRSALEGAVETTATCVIYWWKTNHRAHLIKSIQIGRTNFPLSDLSRSKIRSNFNPARQTQPTPHEQKTTDGKKHRASTIKTLLISVILTISFPTEIMKKWQPTFFTYYVLHPDPLYASSSGGPPLVGQPIGGLWRLLDEKGR